MRARLTLVLAAVGVLAGCSENEAPDDDTQPVRAPEVVRIVPASEALAGAHIPTLDPVTMNDAEIRRVLEAGPRCEFRYTTTGDPVLAVNMRPNGATGGGVVKLNGSLIALEPASIGGDVGPVGSFMLVADPIRMTVAPDRGEQAEGRDGVRRREADMVFEVEQSLRVGYRGYLDCASEPPMESPPR